MYFKFKNIFKITIAIAVLFSIVSISRFIKIHQYINGSTCKRLLLFYYYSLSKHYKVT